MEMLVPPKPMLMDGHRSVNWKKCKNYFLNYVHAIDTESKAFWLRHIIGDENMKELNQNFKNLLVYNVYRNKEFSRFITRQRPVQYVVRMYITARNKKR